MYKIRSAGVCNIIDFHMYLPVRYRPHAACCCCWARTLAAGHSSIHTWRSGEGRLLPQAPAAAAPASWPAARFRHYYSLYLSSDHYCLQNYVHYLHYIHIIHIHICSCSIHTYILLFCCCHTLYIHIYILPYYCHIIRSLLFIITLPCHAIIHIRYSSLVHAFVFITFHFNTILFNTQYNIIHLYHIICLHNITIQSIQIQYTIQYNCK